jgi:hypothetical protein
MRPKDRGFVPFEEFAEVVRGDWRKEAEVGEMVCSTPSVWRHKNDSTRI